MGLNGQIKIHLIENRKDERVAITRILYKNERVFRIQHTHSLEEAWMYLTEMGKSQIFTMPDIIIISSLIVISNNRASYFIQQFKSDEKLKKTLVIILNEFTNEEQLLKLKSIEADYYIVKPLDLGKFNKILLNPLFSDHESF